MTEGTSAPAEPAEGPHDEPPAPGRKRNLTLVVLASALGLLFVAVAIVVPVALEQYREATRPTLDDVQVFEDLRSDHVNDEQDYGDEPPAGGPHDPVWLQCGVYFEQPRTENIVHSLEHGTIWVSYRPGMSDDELEEIFQQLPDESIISPYPSQTAPVVVTVWERQLELDGSDDDRLALFVDEYGDGHTAPEPFASCEGGSRRGEDEGAGGDGIQV